MQHILPFMIPIFGIVFGSMVLIARSPIGHAIARRISGERGVPEDVHQHLLEVQSELESLRAEVAETQERLDFAERLLLKGAERTPGRQAAGS
jgi:hypothetical protein